MRSREAFGRRILGFLLAVAGVPPLMLVSCETRPGTPVTLQVDELPRLGSGEEVRIGSQDDPDAGFSRIGDLEVSADGTLYVLETMAREVRVFSSDGRRIRTVGGPGEGPGEFVRPSSIGLVGDTLWVLDGMGQRLSWFGPDGTLVHETPGINLPVDTDVPGMRLRVVLGEPRSDGFVGTEYSRTMGGGAADRPFYYPVVRLDRNGVVVDTLRWDTVRLGPTVRVGGLALHPPSLRPTSPLEVAVGDDRLQLRWWTFETESDGTLEALRLTATEDTLFRIGLRYRPVPVPGSVRDSLLEMPEGVGRMYGVTDAALRAAMASGLDLPDHRAPLRSAVASRDGSLWIELNGESSDSTAWILLRPDLTPRGELVLPARLRPRHIEGSTVWAVELDDVDVPWLVRLRVR